MFSNLLYDENLFKKINDYVREIVEILGWPHENSWLPMWRFWVGHMKIQGLPI